MKNPDTQVLESLARIQAQEPHFVKWLDGRLAEYHNDAIMQRDDVAMRWAQGRGQEAKDLLDMLRNASSFLRKAP